MFAMFCILFFNLLAVFPFGNSKSIPVSDAEWDRREMVYNEEYSSFCTLPRLYLIEEYRCGFLDKHHLFRSGYAFPIKSDLVVCSNQHTRWYDDVQNPQKDLCLPGQCDGFGLNGSINKCRPKSFEVEKEEDQIPGPTPIDIPGSTPIDIPGPTPIDIPGSTPIDIPGPTPINIPGSTPLSPLTKKTASTGNSVSNSTTANLTTTTEPEGLPTTAEVYIIMSFVILLLAIALLFAIFSK